MTAEFIAWILMNFYILGGWNDEMIRPGDMVKLRSIKEFSIHDDPGFHHGMQFAGAKQVERLTHEGHVMFDGHPGVYNVKWLMLTDKVGINTDIERRLSAVEKVLEELMGACDEEG